MSTPPETTRQAATESADCPAGTAHPIGRDVASALAVTLKALADPLRLRMLSAIATDSRGESCVCDLAELAEVSQPTVSHHLKVLRDVELVVAERRATWVWYRIAAPARPAVTALLDSFAPVAYPASDGHEHEPMISSSPDVDHELDRLSEGLRDRFPTRHSDLVLGIVRDCYTALARTGAVGTHLIPLTERFARQRLTDLSRDAATAPPQVLFVCVANAGRSQLAAALLEHAAGGRVIARSAGSTPAADLHPNVRHLLLRFGEAGRHAFPKPLTDDAVRASDVVVTFGCGDVCPALPGVRYEDWAVGDPALATAEEGAAIREEIAVRVRALLHDLIAEPPDGPGGTP